MAHYLFININSVCGLVLNCANNEKTR